MEIEDLLIKIAKILDGLDTLYVITGGMAVSVWGRTRSTLDVDIVVELIPKNVKALAKELFKIDKNVYLSEDAIKDALERGGEFNFIHPQSNLKVDFWIVKDEFNKQEIKKGISKDFEGYKVRFISPEDLIISKLLWSRESISTKQLEDIESILAITKVDLDYIKKWAVKHGTIDTLNNLIKKYDLSQ